MADGLMVSACSVIPRRDEYTQIQTDGSLMISLLYHIHLTSIFISSAVVVQFGSNRACHAGFRVQFARLSCCSGSLCLNHALVYCQPDAGVSVICRLPAFS